MFATINAVIFLATLSPIWIIITILKGFGVFFIYFAKSVLIMYAGIYGIITSYERFKFYEFFNQLVISIVEMVLKPLTAWDDIFPSFWEFARWENPLLAFFIWFFCISIGMFNR